LLVRKRRLFPIRLPGRTKGLIDMNPRQRRLDSDYRELRARFDGDPHIQITAVGPMPPEEYIIVYRVPSLRLGSNGEVERTQQTVVTVTLPAGYPREKPHATTLDPIFHPNFGDYVCIADFWAPGQSLGDIVANIGDMLQFGKYNIRSPLNAVAAEWANQNSHSLPISNIVIGSVDRPIEIELGATLSSGPEV
jgi:ubiquitin-protein ligase